MHKLEEWPYGNMESSSLVIGEESGYMDSDAGVLIDL